MNGRLIGLWFAALAAMGAAGLIAWSVYSHVSGAANGAGAPAGGAEQMGPAPPAGLSGDGADDIRDIVEGAEQFEIIGMDRNDRTRVAYEMRADTIDPLPGGRYTANSPRAWIYLSSGAVIRIEAATATFLRPAGVKEPESGRFAGAVRILVYHEDDAGSVGPDAPAVASQDEPAPLMALATDSLGFDAVLGEISTADPVRVWTDELTANFTGLKVNVDEVRRRLAYFEAGRSGAGGVVRFSARAREARTAARAGASPGGARSAGSPRSSPGAGAGADPVLDWYRAEFSEAVRLVAGGRTIDADALELWLRTIDGALPERAIARLGGEADAQGAPAAEAPGERGPATPTALEEVTLTWSGPLIVRPLRSEPVELRRDHVVARFTAPVRGVVRLADGESGATGLCAALDYRFTEAQVVLTAPVTTGVRLTMPDAGEAVTGRFELGLKDGVGALVGPGRLRAIGAAAAADAPDPFAEPPAREITWQERCDLVFATRAGAIDASAPAPLREAIFHGSVVGREGASSVRGDFARVSFGDGAQGRMALRRVVIEGQARADSGADGRLSADRLDVAFDSAADGAVVPTVATAQGRVRAEREGETLNAELAEVRLARDDAGELRVEAFSADHAVRVTRANGMETLADHLRVRTDERVVELVGEPAVVHYRGGSIAAGSMRYHELERRLLAFGPGVFNYSRPRGGGAGYERAQIEWTGSMEYDDGAGRAEFVGECVAGARPDELASDLARAHRIVLQLAPGAAASTDTGAGDHKMRLERATLFGGAAEFDGGGPARVESRRYAPDSASETGLTLERLLFLDGPVIVVEAERDVLRVPGAGRLLIEDRRPDEASRAETDPTLRGTTLFEWDGEMMIDRAEGRAEMVRRVRLRQRPPGDAPVTELESERLSAWLRTGDAPSGEKNKPELLRADALGAVYVRQKGRQLIADRLTYDGGAGVAEALASPGNLVTLFEETGTAPLTGSVLRWDLVRDRVEWFDAQSTTAPR